MVGAWTFELCLDRFTAFGDRPHVLRPTVALLCAEHPSLESRPEKGQRFRTAVYLHFVTQRLAWSRRARRSQTEIAWVALVLGAPCVPNAPDSRQQISLACLKRFNYESRRFGLKVRLLKIIEIDSCNSLLVRIPRSLAAYTLRARKAGSTCCS